MHGVLKLLEGLDAQCQDVFDRLEDACSQADSRLQQLEDRLDCAVSRIEAARGSTQPLIVRSSRTFSGRDAPCLHAAARPLGESLLSGLSRAAPLPEAVDAPSLSAAIAADDLAQVIQSVAPCRDTRSTCKLVRRQGERLLPLNGRAGSVSELLLLNTAERPYKARHEVDNLVTPENEAFFLPSGRQGRQGAHSRKDPSGPDLPELNLEEDEPDCSIEDLRFRPGRAAEVTFDLPEVLPDLGNVAHLVWRENEAGGERERPIWDALPAELSSSRRSLMVPKGHMSSTKQPAAVPAMQTQHKVAAPPPPPLPRQPAPAATKQLSGQTSAKGGETVADPARVPAPPVKAAVEVAALAPVPEPAADKAKGKGKGKGPGAPPPVPKKPAAPATKPPPALPKGDNAKLLADIRGGAKLRSVGPPKERTSGVGRVV